MTTAEFLALPDREKDALVAKVVFGWERKPFPCVDSSYDDYGPLARCCSCGAEVNWIDTDKPHDDERSLFLAAYSTSIAAAWEVMEKLGPSVSLIHVKEGWFVFDGFEFCEEYFLSRDDSTPVETAPLAICLYALCSKGVIPWGK